MKLNEKFVRHDSDEGLIQLEQLDGMGGGKGRGGAVPHHIK